MEGCRTAIHTPSGRASHATVPALSDSGIVCCQKWGLASSLTTSRLGRLRGPHPRASLAVNISSLIVFKAYWAPQLTVLWSPWAFAFDLMISRIYHILCLILPSGSRLVKTSAFDVTLGPSDPSSFIRALILHGALLLLEVSIIVHESHLALETLVFACSLALSLFGALAFAGPLMWQSSHPGASIFSGVRHSLSFDVV